MTALARQQQSGGASDCFVTRVLLSTSVHSVSGRVTNQHGSGMSQAEVIVTSPFYHVERTDADGYYTINGLPHGAEVRMYATRYGFTFSPVEAVLPNLSRDETINFSGPAPLAIRSRVLNELGSPVRVPVMISGAVNANAVTAPDGSYLFTVPAGGNYTVMPTPHPDYTYTPTSRSVSNITADQTLDFTARPKARIFARVIHDTGVGFPNVQITLSSPSQPQPLTRTTDSYGSVTFDNLTNGANYTVEASHQFHDFGPVRGIFNDLGGDQTANFTAALRTFSIGGRVTEATNGVAGVTVTLSGSQTATAQTNASGLYSFNGVPAGYNYTLAPNPSAYTYAPTSHLFPALDANQVGIFTMRPPTSTADALAIADLYVRGGTSAGTNYGTATQLITRLSQASNTYETYVKFDLGQRCSVSAVKLRLYGQLSGSGTLGVSVYAVPSTTWRARRSDGFLRALRDCTNIQLR